MKASILLVIAVACLAPARAQGQKAVVERRAGLFVLQDHSLLRGLSPNTVARLLTLGIVEKDTGAISRLIGADTSNVRGLLEICDYLSQSGLEQIKNPEDELSLKDILDLVLDTPDRRERGAQAYFPFIYSMGEKAISKLSWGCGFDYLAFLPFWLNDRQEFLLLFRHQLKHYFARHAPEYGDERSDYVRCLLERFNDISVLEIVSPQALPEKEFPFLKQITDTDGVAINNREFSLTASSQLADRYSPEKANDYDLQTVWAEGSPGDGSGEWIRISLRVRQFVKAVLLFPGHSGSERLFKQNNRVKAMSITFGSKTLNQACSDVFFPVRFPIEAEVDTMRLNVLSVYKGSKYNDLCIGEIILLSK